MKPVSAKTGSIVFSPNLRAGDELANYWMRQATLRLRREIGWIWNERGLGASSKPGELPPVIDRASDSLDLSRHWAEKQEFFATDPAAKYLTEQLGSIPPVAEENVRGSLGWVVRELELDNVSAFTLALGLASAFDASSGAVIGSCLNDPARVYPNLMLVQRLWDRPEEVLSLANPMHPLFATGLLRGASSARRQYPETLWEQPLTVPSLVARKLLGEREMRTPGLSPLDPDGSEQNELTKPAEIVAYRIRAGQPCRMQIIPLLGNRRSAYAQAATDISRISGQKIWEYAGDPAHLNQEGYFSMLATFAWLTGRALFVRQELFDSEVRRERNEGLPMTSIPATLFLSFSERKHSAHIDPEIMLPFVDIPALGYEGRLAAWKEAFGKEAEKYEPTLKEMARRFRYERETIRQVAGNLKLLPEAPAEDDFIAACRAEMSLDIGDLASYVDPRFFEEKLVLPNKQSIQFEEQLIAMKTLTKVHYEWGTAHAWNEGGITIMFAGPPGTGKTMAAEIMAHRLKLPMYRIDLSQVVNKYIGETEKNLKRIFDAADISDMVLFFDEADAIFGKRTEVNDSRDRYANLEVSYLLERMERFKGLAILATNRKDDLDKAFVRRIRHIIDFPVPDEEQRAALWRQIIPPAIRENSTIDIAFLARQFPLSGGHIRSIVFNACLQSAHVTNAHKELFIRDILVAIKREYDKMNRSLSREQLGMYASEIAKLD